MKVSQRGGLRKNSNGALGELLQETAYAERDFAGQENTGKQHQRVGNVRYDTDSAR